jgi:hypothetical protein
MFITHASKLPTQLQILYFCLQLCVKKNSLYMDLKINVKSMDNLSLPLKKRVKGLDSVRLHVMLRFPGIKV